MYSILIVNYSIGSILGMNFDNRWLFAEVVIILIVIAYQIYHTIELSLQIKWFKAIFNKPLIVKHGYIESEKLNGPELTPVDVTFFADDPDITDVKTLIRIAVVESDGKNRQISNIKNALNSYLLNNFTAAVNFSIIKDIIDREIDAEDEGISQAISTPLYLGLAAAMTGIIFGLLAMPELSGQDFLKDIEPLLQGVKVALFASLIGLFCTTILSSFIYRDAKKNILKEKNLQISYLQSSLLPELVKAEDTGVSGLKSSLNRFAREATKITNNVLIASNKTGENIKLQEKILDRVERINVTKVSKVNLELFDRLEQNMESFNRFSEFISNMEKISNNLMEFAARTTNFDKIAENIDSSLQESRRLTRFLSEHFEKIEAHGSAALKAVDLSDVHFKEAIEKLRDETDNRIAILNSLASNHESQLRQVYSKIGEELKSIADQHINQFQTAYQNSVPQFNQLDHLSILPDVKESLTNNGVHFRNDMKLNAEKYLISINDLQTSLVDLQKHLNGGTILNKLDSIENTLQRMKSRSDIIPKPPAPPTPPKQGDLFHRLFSRLSNLTRNK